VSLEDYAPRTDPRGLDRSARLLIAAAALSLCDAGLRVRGASRARTGMIYAALRASPESVARFGRSIDARGLQGLSAAAFARIVLNAPAGFCCKELGLRGPHTALTCWGGSGLLALVVAAEILSTRDAVNTMLATTVDERAADESADAVGEWATAVTLGVADPPGDAGGDAAGTPRVRLAGWGLSGAGDLGSAVRRAARMDGACADAFDATFDGADYAAPGRAHRWAAPSALAFCDAVTSLRAGGSGRVLVTSDAGGGASLAAILRR
jgi:hypothetical protein